MKLFRIYLDTSVFGGFFDGEFSEDSKRLFKSVFSDKVVVLISDIVLQELAEAPQEIQGLLKKIPTSSLESLDNSTQVIELRDAYIAAGIVTRKSLDDATHVAYATVARADAIISWNFKHIARLDKIKAYNKINFEMGYSSLTIISPKEFGL